MSQIIHRVRAFPALLCVCLLSLPALGAFPASARAARIFNVRDRGATGRKEDDARAAIQKTIDACAAADGGIVLFPPVQVSVLTIDTGDGI